MDSLSSFVTYFTVLLIGVQSPTHAQVPTSNQTALAKCRIAAVPTLKISDVDNGPGEGTPFVATDGQRIFLADHYHPTRVQVFDAETGAFVRSLGREGQGPGEFRDVAGIRVWRDTLFVFDQTNLRLSAFSSSLTLLHDTPLKFFSPPYQAFVQTDFGTLAGGWAGPQGDSDHPQNSDGSAGGSHHHALRHERAR